MDCKQLRHVPQRRYNPLMREWVLVSPQRTDRPWQGELEQPVAENVPAYDPNCYLCPGNPRARGARNPEYASTFVFENDFPAMNAHTPAGAFKRDGLLLAKAEPGVCRVVCFSPRHDLTLARMATIEIRAVARHPVRANLREPRGDDGRKQPTPSLPNLGQLARAQRSLAGAGVPAGAPREAG